VTTHAPPIGGLEARRRFSARLGPKSALVYKLVTTTDHKMIGMMYVVACFAFFFIGELMALFIRTELASPGKPIDRDTLVDAVRDTRGRLVIAEVHHPEGGLGSAVLEALVGKETPPLRLAHLAVRIMPGSGTPSELLVAAVIDAASIDSAARHLLDGADRQSDRQDASTPTAQRRSAAPT
jgi:hypothetical protein